MASTIWLAGIQLDREDKICSLMQRRSPILWSTTILYSGAINLAGQSTYLEVDPPMYLKTQLHRCIYYLLVSFIMIDLQVDPPVALFE